MSLKTKRSWRCVIIYALAIIFIYSQHLPNLPRKNRTFRAPNAASSSWSFAPNVVNWFNFKNTHTILEFLKKIIPFLFVAITLVLIGPDWNLQPIRILWCFCLLTLFWQLLLRTKKFKAKNVINSLKQVEIRIQKEFWLLLIRM